MSVLEFGVLPAVPPVAAALGEVVAEFAAGCAGSRAVAVHRRVEGVLVAPRGPAERTMPVAVSHAHGPVQVVGTANPDACAAGCVACTAGARGAAPIPTASDAASRPITIDAAIASTLNPAGGIPIVITPPLDHSQPIGRSRCR